jgi:hypothetical protein
MVMGTPWRRNTSTNTTAGAQPVVELLERKAWVGGHSPRHDDRRLQVLRQQRLEPKATHALDQDPAVGAIACTAASHASLGRVLLERLIERGEHVRRRREAPLPGALHGGPLLMKIERQGRGVALGGKQRLGAHQGEPDPGHALEALVGRSGDGVERHFPGIERQGAKRAHGVDQQPPACGGGDLGDPFDRVQDARGGLAVDRRDMRDRAVLGQRARQGGGIVRLVLRGRQRDHGTAVAARHPDHAQAIGAVHQDQQAAVRGHQGAEHRLDHEGAAALERYADVRVLGCGDAHETLPDARIQRHEAAVPRPPVAQHGLLYGERGGERARGQQIGLGLDVRHGGHSCRCARPACAGRHHKSNS